MRPTQNPRATHLHDRGDFRTPGPKVQPETPAILPPLPAGAKLDRLTLARWLVAIENPLTARVVVNRAWQEFFGRGLAVSSDDFGTRGQRPSHPDLLDWLAHTFRANDWSMKSLHRLIVTSATYRQSSTARPELVTRDPNNALLARQTSLRLSADQVRDATLAASGLLYRRLGGPCAFPPQPSSVVMEGFDSAWTPSKGPDRFRRGLYTFLQRLSPFAQTVTFDAPALSRSCTRRERSNTPLQALTLLNDPVFVKAAQALAARVLRDRPGDFADRLEYAFRLGLSRPPTARERDRLTTYYMQQIALLRDEPATAACLFPQKLAGIDAAEGAAWTGVASVLFNLHEFITRD
jgi:hypothetical protein